MNLRQYLAADPGMLKLPSGGPPRKLIRSQSSLLDEGLLGSECEALLLPS